MQLILKRGVIAGVVILIIGFILNWLFSIIFPSLAQEYQSGIFRPWTDPLMMAFFLHPFIVGIILAYFWELISVQLKGESKAVKAWQFAKLYFVIATIPGMFVSYTSFQVSFIMILTWTVMGFVQAFVCGWIFSSIKK